MTDLERARLDDLRARRADVYSPKRERHPYYGDDDIDLLLSLLTAARREGAEAERKEHAYCMEATIDALKDAAYCRGAEEMRERAASATAFCCFECSRVIRALPLTLEER